MGFCYMVCYVNKIKGEEVKTVRRIKINDCLVSVSQKTTKHLVVKDRQNKSSPGNPLGTTRGQTTRKTDKSSPGNPLGITRGQTTRKTDKSSPGNPLGITRGQTIRQTSLPLATLTG